MSVKTLLEVEIQDEFEKLSEMEVGSEKHKTTIDGLSTLVGKFIEMENKDIEHEEQRKNRKDDLELKIKQIEDEKKDRLIKNCIAVAGIVIPSVITVWGTIKSIKFEQEGTITTIMGRGFVNKLLPRK